MEDSTSSMTITSIHGIPVSQPVRKTPLGRMFAVTDDGRQWTRQYRDRNKIHGGWVEFNPDTAKPVSLAASLGPSVTNYYGNQDVHGEMQLQLVIMHQSEGEVKHWGLFLGRESGNGSMLQVKGDWLQMHYAPTSVANLFTDANYAIAKIYTMALNLTPRQVQQVKETACSVRPPGAANIKEIKGNCQSWCCDVLWKLVKLDLVQGDKVWQVDAVERDPLPNEENGSTRVKAMVGGEWTWITKDDGGSQDLP